MPYKKIPWPLKGTSEDRSYAEQDPLTTRDSQNVRGIDPRTGRARGGQRPGLTKFVGDETKISAADKVSEMAQVVYDSRNVQFEGITSPISVDDTTEAAGTTKSVQLSKNVCAACATDRQNNVYAIDGNATVVKLNADMTEVWRVDLPTEDEESVIRTLILDDSDAVYAAVGSGGNSKKAIIFKVIQLPEDRAECLWMLHPGGFVADMKWRNGVLYTIQNFESFGRSRLVKYLDLESANPVEGPAWKVPFPSNALTLNSKEEILVVSEANAGRNSAGINPMSPTTGPVTIGWDPIDDLEDYDLRIWAHYKGSEINEQDILGGFLEEGAEVLRWRDISGHDRHLYVNSVSGDKPPTLTLNGLGGRPAVKFDGVEQSLASLANPGSKNAQEAQRSMFPAYENSAFCMVALTRPRYDHPTTNHYHTIAGQENEASGATDDIVVAVNRVDHNDEISGGTNAGQVSAHLPMDNVDGGAGAGDQLQSTSFTENDLGACLVTVLHDGGINQSSSTTFSGSTFTRSLFRVNGTGTDRGQGDPFESSKRSILGHEDQSRTNPDYYEGELSEIIILQRKDPTGTLAGDDTDEDLVLSHDATPDTVTQTANELTRIEGYVAHGHGCQSILDSAHPYDTAAPQKTGATADVNSLNNVGQILSKFTNDGELVAISTGLSGVGYGVAANSDDNVYTAGPQVDSGSNDQFARLIVDSGGSFSSTGGDTWVARGNTFGDQAYQGTNFIKLAVDAWDNVYVPLPTDEQNDPTLGVTVGPPSVFVFEKEDSTNAAQLLTRIFVDFDGGNDQACYGVALPHPDTNPDYDSGDFLSTPGIGVNRPEYVFVATDPQGHGGSVFPLNETLHKVNYVTRTAEQGTPRQFVYLATAAQNIFKFNTTTVSSPATDLTDPFVVGARYIQSAVVFGEVVWTDGVSPYVTYVPRDDEVKLFETTHGELGDHYQLVERWGGRLVWARGDDAQDWKMSKNGDIRNYDVFPPVETADQAISGVLALSGACPDIINTLVPFNDDLLLFGCDSSIWRLTGDPMAGGRMDLVTDITGMAFGRPWAKDPQGRMWFVGSRGALYVISPHGGAQRVSVKSVERQLQDLFNFTDFYPRMEYDYRQEGLVIRQMPYGDGALSTGATIKDHWFYDIKHGAFYRDRGINTTSGQGREPMSMMVVDADDPDDRRLLIAGEDGNVRYMDEDKTDDDGPPTTIDSYVTLGPLGDPAAGMEYGVTCIEVTLADDQGGCGWELFATNDPTELGPVRAAGALHSGQNAPIRERVRGRYIYLRLRSNTAQRWALEQLAVDIQPIGTARVRA